MIEYMAGLVTGIVILALAFALFDYWVMRPRRVQGYHHYRAICPGCTIHRATRIAP